MLEQLSDSKSWLAKELVGQTATWTKSYLTRLIGWRVIYLKSWTEWSYHL